MSSDEQKVTNSEETTNNMTAEDELATEAIIEQDRSEKILKAKELYSHGSRSFLLKSFSEAADELSEVCALYGELYGELSDELGMPYLLYAKSLIALALDENKVIHVPDEDDDDDDEEEEEGDEEEDGILDAKDVDAKAVSSTKSSKLENIKEDEDEDEVAAAGKLAEISKDDKSEKITKTTEDTVTNADTTSKEQDGDEKPKNGKATSADEMPQSLTVDDGEKPSTSNGDALCEEDDENEAASNLQLAWEILELAAKIFSRQGERGLANLAEVETELANIEFENNILDAAREDYEKALNIYKDLPKKYRRAMAEIHYKIGLSFLMQQQNKEGAASLKEACNLIAGEIDEIKAKTELTEKDKNNIQDMEETKQEIEAKIIEIEETQAQNIAEVRAALDSYIKPFSSGDVDAGSSKSATTAPTSTTSDGIPSASLSSASRPTDISHLIKRKKPEDLTSEADSAVDCSPAKRPAV